MSVIGRLISDEGIRTSVFIPGLLAATAILRAQEPLNLPAPLVPAIAAPSPARDALTRAAAERAQELGFPTVAAGLYRELLNPPRGDHLGLTLALATALLDDGRPEEAGGVLQPIVERGPAWHLRWGLVAARERRFDAARSEAAAVKPGDLAAADRPWYFFLQGMLAGAAGDPVRAGDFYDQAQRAAGTDLERARFLLAHEQARLRVGAVTAPMADQMERNAATFQGSSTGYAFARSYAVILDALGRKGEAVAYLQHELAVLPGSERDRADDFRLLLGLIAGAEKDPGQRALLQLLETGVDPDRQRVALQLLATASPGGLARAIFRTELDKLIGAPPSRPHPILEDLLLFSSSLALADKDNAKAEDEAHELLEKFPGSPLKPYALSVLTASAWEQRRYRTAADDANQARAEPLPPEARAELGVVVAEAWFRAGDFRSAADAYAAALLNPPAIVRPGDLMFQRVAAEIRAGEGEIAAGGPGEAGALRAAQAALDELERNPALDAANRWRAEWNLSRALQGTGQTDAAYARVNRILGATSAAERAGLSPELRAQMAWLQARLSLDAGQPARTLQLVEAMVGSLAGLPPDLRTSIAGTAALLRAQAYFALKQEAPALAALAKLREDFPHTDAAAQSYFAEADYYAQEDEIVRAQGLLTRLADDFPQSDYAPSALYDAALQAERLGQDKNFREAYRLLENLVTKYKDSALVFDARLKQGDLLRELYDFAGAEQVYESLRNNFAQNPGVIKAELALAECHNAQSATDPLHADRAITLFADLRDRVDAPVEMRVEAGFCLGDLYERNGNGAQAQAVWWRDVVSAFLLDPRRNAELGTKGRYWMARTLLYLGELYVKQGKLDEARKAWTLVLTAGLPGAALAQENLAGINKR